MLKTQTRKRSDPVKCQAFIDCFLEIENDYSHIDILKDKEEAVLLSDYMFNPTVTNRIAKRSKTLRQIYISDSQYKTFAPKSLMNDRRIQSLILSGLIKIKRGRKETPPTHWQEFIELFLNVENDYADIDTDTLSREDKFMFSEINVPPQPSGKISKRSKTGTFCFKKGVTYYPKKILEDKRIQEALNNIAIIKNNS